MNTFFSQKYAIYMFKTGYLPYIYTLDIEIVAKHCRILPLVARGRRNSHSRTESVDWINYQVLNKRKQFYKQTNTLNVRNFVICSLISMTV